MTKAGIRDHIRKTHRTLLSARQISILCEVADRLKFSSYYPFVEGRNMFLPSLDILPPPKNGVRCQECGLADSSSSKLAKWHLCYSGNKY